MDETLEEKRPADICFARGTFNAHPVVMSAMKAFLDEIEKPEIQALYEGWMNDGINVVKNSTTL